MPKGITRVHSKDSINSTIISFVEKFIQTQVPHLASNYLLKPYINENDFGKGGFGCELMFQLFSKDETFLYMIKSQEISYPESQNIPLLIPFCELMQKLPLESVKLLFPTFVDSLQIDLQFILLTATPAAEGILVTQIMDDYSQGHLPWEKLTRVMHSVGRALFELNAAGIDVAQTLTSKLQKKDDNCVDLFLLYLRDYSEWFPFDINAFKKKYAEMFHLANVLPYIIGYVHGDCNLTNFFYNESKNIISLVDSLTIFDSIDKRGKPMGNVTKEVAYAKSSIYLFGTYYGIDQSKLKLLEEAFFKAYPLPLFPQHLNLYTLHYWMEYTIVLYKILQRKPALRESLKKLMSYAINKIKEGLDG